MLDPRSTAAGTLVLGPQDCEALLEHAALVDVLAEAHRQLSIGGAVQPAPAHDARTRRDAGSDAPAMVAMTDLRALPRARRGRDARRRAAQPRGGPARPALDDHGVLRGHAASASPWSTAASSPDVRTAADDRARDARRCARP